jgi:hypothetical protein
MKTKISFEIDISDYMDESNVTIPFVEEKIEEMIIDLFSEYIGYPEQIKVEVFN